MKKITLLVLAVLTALSLVACTGITVKIDTVTTTSANAETTAPAETEPAETTTAPAQTESDSTTYRIYSYTANGLTYSGGDIDTMQMRDTYLTLNKDHSGYLALSGEGFDISWTDAGAIQVSGVDLYSFTMKDADTLILNMFESIDYTLIREGAEPAETEPAETEPAETEPAETEPAETEPAETEPAETEPAETEPAPAASGNEPVPTGDGEISEENLFRLMKYYDYMGDMSVKLTYPEMVAVAGAEGLDKGNDGPNSMTEYGDRLVKWTAGSKSVLFTFRRTDDEDVWTCRQWSGSISFSDFENIDISDLLGGGESSEMVPGSDTLVAFMTDIETKVNYSIPSVNWVAEHKRDAELDLYNTAGDTHNAPQMDITVQSSLDRINFYIDQFENLQEIESRTIGGIEMAGRTYKSIGFNWTEYYGELPNGVWVSIAVTEIPIGDGTEGSAVLDSLSFE